MAYLGEDAARTALDAAPSPKRGPGRPKRAPSMSHKEFVAAAVSMEMGDPPLRWSCPEERIARSMFNCLRYGKVAAGMGFWTHLLNGELWVIRYE